MGKIYSNLGSPCGGNHLILLNHKNFSESNSKILYYVHNTSPPPTPPKKKKG